MESLLQAADKGNASQVMECLSLDNAKQNLMRKKSRTMPEKPEGEGDLKQTIKRPTVQAMATPVATAENKENVVKATANEQEAEDSDSYEFNPVCENCAG